MAMATASNSHNSLKSTARLLSSSSIFSSSSSSFVPDRSTMTTTVQWQRLDPPPPSHFGMSRRSGHVAFVVPRNNSNNNDNNQKQQQEPLQHRANRHDDDDDVVLVDDAAMPTLLSSSSSSSSSSLYYQPYVFGGYIETDLSQRQEQDGASTTTNDNDNDNTNSPVPVVERTVTNDLWMWEYELTSNNNNNNTDGDVVQSINRSAWISIPTTGDVPIPRLVAAAVAINSYQVYLLGGWNPAEIDPMKQPILDTVDLLDLNTQSWKQLPIRIPGGPTSRHVAAYIPHQHCILIHNHRCQDYVLLLDPNKVIVVDHHEDNDNNLNHQDCWIQQPTTGPCPSPRGLHAAVMLNESLLLLFGGAAQDGTMSNQVFILNTQTWIWSELMPLLLEDDNNNNNDDNRNHPNDNDNHNKIKIPSPRAASCLVTTTSSSKHDDGDHDDHVIVWLFGGAERTSSGGLRACNDLWSLQLPSLSSLMMMEQRHDQQQQPASSSSSSANACPQSSLPSSRLGCQWSQILPEENPLSSSKHHEWPPGRNAATLVPICRTSTTTPRRGGGVTAAGTMKTTTYSFLLYGGWEPFQRTWDDCYLLHIRSGDGQEDKEDTTQRRQI